MHRSFTRARAALFAQLAVLVFAPVSVLAGSNILLHLSPGGAVRAWNLSRIVPTDTAGETRSHRQMLSSSDGGGFTLPVVTEAPAVPSRLELPAARQLEIATAIGHGPALSESELTFTKGYPQRRAAQLAAGLSSQPAMPQLTSTADVATSDVFDPRFGQGARIPRSAAASRPRIRKHARVHDRYAEFKP
jgi:hypothetical protein